MRWFSILLILAVVALPALAGAKDAERQAKRIRAHLKRGEQKLALVPELQKNAARLRTLDRSLYYLRKARTISAKQKGAEFSALTEKVNPVLVRALVDQASIYYARTSLKMADKRVDEALSIVPEDASALRLKKAIRVARETDIYEQFQGTAAINRIRARRAAAGIPLRDRGAARRR